MTFEVFAAKFLLNDLTGMFRKFGADRSRLPAFVLGPVLRLAYAGVITRTELRAFCAEVLA